MKFKVGGLKPEEDAARFCDGARSCGPRLRPLADANQGWTPRQAIRFARLVEDSTCTGSRSRAAGRTTGAAMRDVRFAAGVRVCAGQSEFSAAGAAT